MRLVWRKTHGKWYVDQVLGIDASGERWLRWLPYVISRDGDGWLLRDETGVGHEVGRFASLAEAKREVERLAKEEKL